MTYGVGVLVRDGLVMMADTRTNAGVDNVSSYRKLRVMATGPGRVMTIASAGSLSVTQGAMTRLMDAMLLADDGVETLDNAPTMFRAATLVGQALAASKDAVDRTVSDDKIATGASLLFGGCILQIGEHKYGKPILDRAVSFDTPLYEAVKTALISFNSTMRSNLAVGLPIDLVTIRSGECVPELVHRIDADDDYYRELDDRWSNALRLAQAAIPLPPYGQGGAQGALV